MEEYEIPIYVYNRDIKRLKKKHYNNRCLDLDLHPFCDRRFPLGDFKIKPFPVPHWDGFRTFGFELRCAQYSTEVKLAVATDFKNERNLSHLFENSHFIYIESNHDLELLRKNPNPNSMYHLSNEQCGRLLRRSLDESDFPPMTIMLGHLSEVRNDPALAKQTVKKILREGGHNNIPVFYAPRYRKSNPVTIYG